ncbi:hypothetical protein J2W42_004198 [Rhizobium tibeticum]|nr:hypothetical protein [Rhizobium tibeticum]
MVGWDVLFRIMTSLTEGVGIACVHIGSAAKISSYGAILDLDDNGAWQWRTS